MKRRYVITHLQKDGLRALAFPNQGRNHYDTKEQAEKAREALKPELESKLGFRALEVRETDCYDHGDAVGIYSPMNLEPVTGKPFSCVCAACGKSMTAGDGSEVYWNGTVYADTLGTPWKAYYCSEDAKPTLVLQEVTRATSK